ncbi:amidase [Candidatus Kaiserbacteria bacterium]|nr:amidase [Candidatus Kaiserbacteria bacterium]
MNRLFIDNSIGEIIEKYVRKELAPRDVAADALQNIAELDPLYFAWVSAADAKWPERVQNEAEIFGINEKNLLEYIPVGIKDIYNTRDFPTQMGSPLWKDFTPGNDARAVYYLKRAGAIVAGKTVTAEFAVHALDKTLNPYDTSKTPGTSSSGSAVAVSLGIVPLATGSQTAGSIVRPASFCGIYGMKPSFGLIPRTGTLKTTDSLDTLGFFVLHAEDLRRGFDALRVRGENYPISHAALSDVVRQQKTAKQPWRVALVKTHTWKHAPDYAKEALLGFVKKLTAVGMDVTETELPEAMAHTHKVHETIYNKSLSYYFAKEYTKTEFVSPIMNELIASGNAIAPEQFAKALADQNELIYAMDDFFKNFDILISLSTAGEAPPREVTELPDPALMWTLAHLPVVSAPVFASPGGLPFGMQVAARKYNDCLLLSFIEELRAKSLIPSVAGFCTKKRDLDNHCI